MAPGAKELQGLVDRQSRALLAALTDPGTLVAGMQAMKAVRRVADVTVRRGPKDPEVREALQDAERAVLRAVQEASTAWLRQLGEEGAAGSEGTSLSSDLQEVPVERSTPRRKRRGL